MGRSISSRTRNAIVQDLRADVAIAEIARRRGVARSTVYRIQGAAPFSGDEQGAPNIPPPQLNVDQPPPPRGYRYDPQYHGYTFRAPARPAAIEGWDLDRIRNAITLHDQGIFHESSLLSVIATRFAPVYAALGQALAPALGLPRFIRGGDDGLSGQLRGEIEAQLAPRKGLTPSPYFPPTLWGSMQFDLAMMGFSVLQHVESEEDPDTGVRQIYTRRWPTWAVQQDAWRQTYQAITTDGPVDIISGDGKFTLVGDVAEPHLDGAIRALGMEVMDGALVKQSRASYIDRYGNPKWVATMPEGVSTRSKEGDDFFSAVQTIQGPDGVGVFPFGSTYSVEQMTAQQSTVFKDALENVWKYIAAILLGTDGTMSPGSGVYTAPIFAGVRRDVVHRRLMAMVRAVNSGHIAPWLAFNYAASIEADERWVEPVLEIPLPDPGKELRIEAFSKRAKSLAEIIKGERDAGLEVSQDRVDWLAAELEVPAPKLAAKNAAKWNVELAPTTQEKLLRVDEGRAALGGEPVGDERGQLFIVELDQEIQAKREEATAEAEAQAQADAEIEVEEQTSDEGEAPSDEDEEPTQ